MKKYLALIMLFPLLAGCMSDNQDTYRFDQLGQSSIVEFGTVLKTRPIKIDEGVTGVGTLAGGAAGAGLGSTIGGGHGRTYTGIGGALAGAVIGTIIEQNLRKDDGIEYTIATEKGKVISIAQALKENDPIFQQGTRVMVQTSGSYQRVMSADGIPTDVQRPKGVNVVD